LGLEVFTAVKLSTVAFWVVLSNGLAYIFKVKMEVLRSSETLVTIANHHLDDGESTHL
jgi:hypothetical protein